ncbi:MAG: response regulator [Planctomycetaceae bacterium]|nr:response regulator [Planctomycetaceae bacterium]
MNQAPVSLSLATKERILRYSVAVFCTVFATILRMELEPWIGDRVPFGTYLLSVLMTAFIAGTGPAIASLIMGIIAAGIYIIPTSDTAITRSVGDLIALGIYGVVGAATIWLFHSMSRQNADRLRQIARIEVLTAELKVAGRQKDEFMAILSHELRNPLAPLRNGIQLLKMNPETPDEQQNLLCTMTRQMDQLVAIVDDLLDVSRFVHGKMRLVCSPVDLRELVDHSLCQAKCLLEERKHHVQVLLPAKPVIVNGDRNRLTQIVTNLLTNAAKYTPREGRIQVILDQRDQSAILRVVDNGIGISEEMQPRIFELFTRSDSASKRDSGGLGLGLPIARQFALMHDGQLTVSSEGRDHGTQFELRLPSLQAKSVKPFNPESDSQSGFVLPPASAPIGNSPASSQDSTSVENTDDNEPMRVLIVDDNVDASETLASLLSFSDFDTQVCHSGVDALALAKVYHPDVILLDIGMPGMDGYQLARTLRQDPANRDLVLVAVTGWGDDKDQQKSMAAGINHHLVKPVDIDRLHDILNDIPVGAS